MPRPATTRIDSLSILADPSGQALLKEAYGKVIDNVQKATISSMLKNQELSGDPGAGSVEAERFTNTESKNYGTARSSGGQKIKAKPVVIQLDQDKELINEVEEKDVKLYGVPGLIQKKSAQNEKTMKRELERAFFSEAATGGTAATLTATTIQGKLEEVIQLIETTKNDYVDGVDRDMINVICTPAIYGQVRDYLDTLDNANVDSSVGEFGGFHGVKVFSSVYMPDGYDMIAMVDGSVAQPVWVTPDEAGKFPASNAYHFGIFYSYGTNTVAPDLIQVVATPAGT